MAIRSERRFIGLPNVRSGMMVQFVYRKAAGSTDKYTVLVVDPDRKNARAKEPQLHGYTIDNMTDEQLIQFFSSFRKPMTLGGGPRDSSIVDELGSDEAYKAFGASRFASDRRYRTFNHSGISQLRQILLGSVEE
jgi:hypothetical protein